MHEDDWCTRAQGGPEPLKGADADLLKQLASDKLYGAYYKDRIDDQQAIEFAERQGANPFIDDADEPVGGVWRALSRVLRALSRIEYCLLW